MGGLSQNQNYTNAVGVVSRVTTNQLVLLQFRYIFISRELNLLVFFTFPFILSCYYSRLLKLLSNFTSNFKGYSNNLPFKISYKILFKTSFKIFLKYLVNHSMPLTYAF